VNAFRLLDISGCSLFQVGGVAHVGVAAALFFLVAGAPAHAQSSTLLLESNQPGATVLLDGQEIGETSQEGKFYSAEVPAGEHRIAVRKSGYETASTEKAFEEGLTTTVSLSLNKEQEPPGEDPTSSAGSSAGDSYLIVNANVGGARVYLDGEEVGRTHRGGKLQIQATPAAVHRIRVEKDGFEPTGRSVEAPPPSLTSTVDITLSRPEGILGQLGGQLESLQMSQPTVLLALVLVAGIFALAVVIVVLQDSGGVPGQATQVARQFDRYGVGEPIGEGGMATVYAAKDRGTGQEVALKIMAREHLDDPDLVRKFLKEGEALERIHSPSPAPTVVEARRYGREDGRDTGRPFLALERLEGEALIGILDRKGSLPARPALQIVERICQGLQAAHRCDIWHRDVTPENVIVLEPVPTSRVKLIDFGVAKHEYTRSGTLDGSITGKPPYMSPEQCRGEPVSGKSDVYSLGVLTFVLLTGSPPFTDRNPVQVLKMHQEQPPPDLPGSVPAPASRLVGEMLRKDPDARPSAREVQKRIQSTGLHSVETA
jgi:hypothetical protein